jgi:copper chaperone CopZ
MNRRLSGGGDLRDAGDRNPDLVVSGGPTQDEGGLTRHSPLPEPGQWDIVAVRLSISGMHCDRCAETIEQRLGATPGVISIRVDHQKNKAAVCFDPASLDVPASNKSEVRRPRPPHL